MTPFERFFDEDFGKMLDRIRDEPGIRIAGSSWDRKAAFLLWNVLGRPTQSVLRRKDDFGDLLG